MTPAATDFELIFEALANAHVRYLVVGGVAVVLHGYTRFTADLDLVVALEPVNARAAMAALSSLGYRPRAPVRAVDFADPVIRKQWIEEKGLAVFSLWSDRFPATEVDVFVEEPMPFEEMAARGSELSLHGSPVAVAAIEDLILMKEKVGRPQDLQDAAELRNIAAMRRT